jgi:hypothetical protein
MEKVWEKIDLNHNVVQMHNKKSPNMENNMEKKKAPCNHEVFQAVIYCHRPWVGGQRLSGEIVVGIPYYICEAYLCSSHDILSDRQGAFPGYASNTLAMIGVVFFWRILRRSFIVLLREFDGVHIGHGTYLQRLVKNRVVEDSGSFYYLVLDIQCRWIAILHDVAVGYDADGSSLEFTIIHRLHPP